MEQNEPSTSVSQPSMMELGGNKKDHHLSSWTENNIQSYQPTLWDENTKDNLDTIKKKGKQNFYLKIF